jgi:hemerythrin-like domain-containing protein
MGNDGRHYLTMRTAQNNSATNASFEEEAMFDPIAIFENEQEEFLELCTALEQVADALPGNIDHFQVYAAIPFLRNGFAELVALQEKVLFAALRRRAILTDNVDGILAQMEREHASDQGLAIEVAEALGELRHGRRPDNPEMLGYLLRCFFEGQRRHAAWERLVLYPLCRERLTSEDVIELTQRLACTPRFVFKPCLLGV